MNGKKNLQQNLNNSTDNATKKVCLRKIDLNVLFYFIGFSNAKLN